MDQKERIMMVCSDLMVKETPDYQESKHIFTYLVLQSDLLITWFEVT